MKSVHRQIIRLMASERAKGELNSILHAYTNESKKYWVMKELIDSFIKRVEINAAEKLR